MIKIQNFRAMMLSCQISNITILTDKEYVDVSVRSSTQTLLAERYFATDSKVILYDMRSLIERCIRDAGLAMDRFTIAAEFRSQDSSGESSEASFRCIYCDRDIDIYDFEPLLRSHFLTSAVSRRVAPESFVFLPFFAYAGDSLGYDIYVDYVLKETGNEERGACVLPTINANATAAEDGIQCMTIYLYAIKQMTEDVVGSEVEVTAYTVRVGDRAASFFIDKSLAGTRPFYFRNCFNVSDNLFVPAVTTAKTKVDRSLAVLGRVSQFYDATCEQTYEVQSAGLTADECSLAEQMFCSDDVRTPYESAPDDGDFDALRTVLITDSTSEIADDPEKPNTVKFTWRYAENRIAQRNPLGSGIFTEPYDYTFR